MNGESRTKKSPLVILLFAAALFVVAASGYLIKTPESDPDHFFIASSGGDVMLKHKNHASDLQCADCHHDLLSSDSRTACSECHGDNVDPADFEHSELTALTDHRCTTCHNLLHNDPPANCRTCHLKEVSGTTSTAGCAACHDEEMTADALSHDEMLEIESHTCAGCHPLMAISDACHQQCSGCHLKSGQKRFANAEGVARCEICHLK